MRFRWFKNPKVLILTPLTFTLLFLIACGGDATATPRPAPAPLDTAALRTLVQEAVQEATAGAEPAISEQALAQLVEQAVAAAAPEGASPAEIAALVEQAVAAATTPGITSDQVEALVSSAVSQAVAAFPTPVPTATAIPTATPAPTPTPRVLEPVLQRLVVLADLERESNDPALVLALFQGPFLPMYESLVDYNQQLQYEPMLATDWEFSPDFRSYTFNLRKGIPFHYDFGEFTAKDVKHTWDRLTREDAAVAYLNVQREWDFEIVDDYKITLNMPDPMSNFRIMSNGMSGFILNKDHFDAEGQEGVEKRAVGTGPYQFVERKLGEYILFERVPYDHWRINVDFAELEIRNVKDAGTRLAMLLTEEAHIGLVPAKLHPQVISRGLNVVKAAVPGTPIYGMFGGNYLPSDPAFDPSEPLTKPKVREALNRAINREEIRDNILGGRGEFMVAPFYHPSIPGFDQSWVDDFEENYGYDAQRARELLVEAGYPDGFKIRYILSPSASVPELKDIGEAVGTYWKEIGVDVEFEERELLWFVDRFLNKNMTNMVWLDGTRRLPEPWNLTTVRSTGCCHFYESEFIDVRYEELEIKPTTDPVERARLLREIGQHQYEEYSMYPLFWTSLEAVINPKYVDDFTTSGYSFPRDLEYVKAVFK